MTNTAQPQGGAHFPDSEWVDFVRNVLPAARRRELRSHLETDCLECVRSVEFWKSVKNLSAQPEPEPPWPVLRAAQELFNSRSPWAWLRMSAEWAQPIFDSLRQTAPALIRGSTEDVRHLIYEAEPFVIDVTVKADPAQSRLSLLGQVLNPRTPGQVSEEEIHVVLLSGEDLIAKTVASYSGEFQLSCEVHSDLSLLISVRGERAIGLSLADSGRSASA